MDQLEIIYYNRLKCHLKTGISHQQQKEDKNKKRRSGTSARVAYIRTTLKPGITRKSQ